MLITSIGLGFEGAIRTTASTKPFVPGAVFARACGREPGAGLTVNAAAVAVSAGVQECEDICGHRPARKKPGRHRTPGPHAKW